MRHLVYFSGGVGSWAAAKRVALRYGTENLTLLFADVKMEDEDLYRFINEAAANVGAPLTTITAGMTPWELFEKKRFIGNSQVDPCSKTLKRDLLNRYRSEHFSVEDTVTHFGIDWTEENRLTGRHGKGGLRHHPDHRGWALEAPLCHAPYLNKTELLAALELVGIAPPRLYAMGYPHNNCGGFCVKAGHASFAHLLSTQRSRYLWHEGNEERLRTIIGKDVSIMRSRAGGKTTPLTMRTFRERIEAGGEYDQHDWGGCGCAL